MTAKKPWWNQPLRVVEIGFCSIMAEMDYEQLGRLLHEFHANVTHFGCHRDTRGGFHPDEVYCHSRVATRQNRDVLAEFIPIAKRYGVRVVLYVNGHWFNTSFVDQHPDWWVIQEDGSRVDHLYGDDDSTFCINSPWRDWMRMRIEDFCQYDIDGLFWDGPITFLGRKACYCPCCKRKFKAMFGREMPTWDRQNRDNWHLLTEFAVASLTEYYRDAYGWVKSLKPNAAVYLNAANVAEPAWVAGRDNHRLLPYTDILLSEGGFYYGRLVGGPEQWKVSASSKFYETQACGKPAINGVSSADSPWRRCQLGSAEMRVLLANASRGVNPYVAFFIEGLGQSGDRASKDVCGFLHKNAEFYTGTRSVAKVALLVSNYTLNHYAGVNIPWMDLSSVKAEAAEAPGNHSLSFYGHYEMLVRAHVPFDVLDDTAVEGGRLKQYRLLVLPTAACLSAAECEAIAQFVRDGGTVIADFETSHYDDRGRRQRELGLAAVFGVTSLNEVVGPRRWDFARVSEARVGLDRLDVPVIPATRHNLRVTSTSGKTLMVLSAPVISNIPDEVNFTQEPFLVENFFGKGKSCYFPGTLGELFMERRFPSYQRMLTGIVERAITPLVRLDDTPHLIEVNVREQPEHKRYLVHLINYELRDPERVIPALNVKVTVETPWCVCAVRALRLEQDLDFKQADSRASFVLPRLEEFEVIAVQGRA